MSDVVDLCTALIRNRCVNTGEPTSGHEIRSVETVTGYLGDGGVVVEPLPGRGSVVYRTEAEDPSAPRLMLMGHLDVVPVDETGWSRDPFAGDLVDGVLWGRGAVDMLNITAAMTVVAKRVLDGTLPTPPGGFAYLAVADEEAGGTHGAQWLFEQRPELVACDDLLTEIAYPTFRLGESTVQPVMVAEKGPSWRTLTSTGIAGHGSAPHGKPNAIAPLVEAAAQLLGAETTPLITDEWRAFVAALDLDADATAALTDPSQVDGVIASLADSAAGIARYVHACTRMTVAPTMFHAGEKANTIPSAGSLTLDVRLLPGQPTDAAAAFLDDRIGHVRAQLHEHIHQNVSGNSSPTDGRLWRAIRHGYRETAGDVTLAPAMTPASTDARFFRQRGINAYGAGWFDDTTDFGEFLDMFHGHDERISVTSLERSVALLEAIVVAYASA